MSSSPKSLAVNINIFLHTKSKSAQDMLQHNPNITQVFIMSSWHRHAFSKPFQKKSFWVQILHIIPYFTPTKQQHFFKIDIRASVEYYVNLESRFRHKFGIKLSKWNPYNFRILLNSPKTLILTMGPPYHRHVKNSTCKIIAVLFTKC